MKHEFKKGDKVLVMGLSEEKWVVQVFSHFKDGLCYCFISKDGRFKYDSRLTYGWLEWKPYEEEQPEPQEQPIQIPGLVHFRLCTLTDTELAKAVSKKLQAVYDNKMSANSLLSRHVPARPNEDFDLLVGELIFRLLNKK